MEEMAKKTEPSSRDRANSVLLDAYSEKGASPSAVRTLRTPSVKSRVAELQMAAANSLIAAVRFDHARLLARLDALSREAERAGQFSAAIRAVELIGWARGLFVERTQEVDRLRKPNAGTGRGHPMFGRLYDFKAGLRLSFGTTFSNGTRRMRHHMAESSSRKAG